MDATSNRQGETTCRNCPITSPPGPAVPFHGAARQASVRRAGPHDRAGSVLVPQHPEGPADGDRARSRPVGNAAILSPAAPRAGGTLSEVPGRHDAADRGGTNRVLVSAMSTQVRVARDGGEATQRSIMGLASSCPCPRPRRPPSGRTAWPDPLSDRPDESCSSGP